MTDALICPLHAPVFIFSLLLHSLLLHRFAPLSLSFFLQVRLLYCSLEEAELIFRAAWAAGQAGPSHMWFAVGPALSGLGLEGLPKALFAIRPQGWRDEPRRYEQSRCAFSFHGFAVSGCQTRLPWVVYHPVMNF